MRQEMVSMICGAYSYAKSEMLSNTHTNRTSTVTLAVHARRGLTSEATLTGGYCTYAELVRYNQLFDGACTVLVYQG